MKYMLLMYGNESEAPKTPEEHQAVAQAWYGFGEEAKAAGVLISNNGLDPIAHATTVRVRDSKTLITDGPFAETHEQLGGYYLLDCKDLDEALRWAEKIPTAKYGSIELRPLNQWSQKS
ncbi:MAG TPA: YciI family protein [Anaerolineales bacterium]|nr:YciI family protein [Anaerolineales bacterium]